MPSPPEWMKSAHFGTMAMSWVPVSCIHLLNDLANLLKLLRFVSGSSAALLKLAGDYKLAILCIAAHASDILANKLYHSAWLTHVPLRICGHMWRVVLFSTVSLVLLLLCSNRNWLPYIYVPTECCLCALFYQSPSIGTTSCQLFLYCESALCELTMPWLLAVSSWLCMLYCVSL